MTNQETTPNQTSPTTTDPPSFVDGRGHRWYCNLSIGLARRIRDEMGLDFGRVVDGKVFLQLAADPYLFAAALWYFVEHQADAAEISPETFAELLTGDVRDDALDALVEAVVLFTPAPMRGPLRQIINQTKRAQATALETVSQWALAEGDRLTKETATKTRESLDRLTSGATSRSSKASSVSTPSAGPTPSYSTPHAKSNAATGTS